MVNLSIHLGREKTVAVVDISEGRASVAILSCEKGAACEVLAYGHSALTLDKHSAADEIAAIGQKVAEAGQIAQRAYESAGRRAPITQAYAILHAPWIRSEEVVTHQSHEDDTRITDAMVSELAKTALNSASAIDSSRFYEASVTRVELNGYPVREPAGKYVRDIAVVSLLSDCDTAARDAAQKAISQLFPVAEIAWRSNLRTIAAVLRDSARYEECVAIEVGMNETQVIALRPHGLIQYTVQEGARTILSRVAPGTLPEETLSTMRLLASDSCSTESCEAIEKALVLAEPDLAHIFGEALAGMAAQRRIPNDVILCAQSDIEPYLSRFLSRIDFAQFTITMLPFTVHATSELELKHYVARDVHDPSLLFACALVNIEERD